MAADGKTYLKSSMKRLFLLLGSDRKAIFYIYFYAVFAGLVSLTVPLGVQAIIGIISSQQLATSWAILIILIVLGLIFSGVLKILQKSIIEVLQQKVFARASFEFAYRIPRFKMDLLHKFYPPELVNRFFDVLNIQKGIEKIVLDFATAGVQAFFSLLILAFYHPLFVIFGVVFVGLLLLIFRSTLEKGMYTSIKESNEKYEMASWLEELARSMATFKLWGDDVLALKKTNEITEKYIEARQKHFKILKTQMRSEVMFKVLITSTFLVLGSILVIDQQINIGQFVAAEIIVITLVAAVEKAVYSMSAVFDTLTALEKVGYVTDIPNDNDEGIDFKEAVGENGIKVTAKKIGYNFKLNSDFSLKDISFELLQGKKLCISGYHGSGKSILIDVICGFYENFNGELSFDDIPVQNIKNSTLQKVIGDNLSQQDIFRGSIKENITLGTEIDLKELIQYCTLFGIMEFIKKFPDGFDTQLYPEGREIPRNVISKIILIRSIIKKPKLLIMDDFMTSLEGDDKKRILDYLYSPERKWTVIMSSNDAEVAKRSDMVMILSAGKSVAMASYEEVIKNEDYKKIFY